MRSGPTAHQNLSAITEDERTTKKTEYKCRIDKKTPAQLFIALSILENPAVNHIHKPPVQKNLQSTPLQQLSVQQASRQIRACDHDRTNNPAPGFPEYHMIKH